MRGREFFESAIEDQHQTVTHSNGIESASIEIREAGEVISKRGFLVALQVVIAECRINRNIVFKPDFGFGIPDLPILRVFAGVDDVASDRNERGVLLIDGRHEGLADSRIGRFGIGRVVEARITEGNESKLGGGFEGQSYRICASEGMLVRFA